MTIIGPYIFAEKLVTANTYLNMLQLYTVPQLPDGTISSKMGLHHTLSTLLVHS